MDNNREELLVNISDKLFISLLEIGKSVKHLFIYLFTLLLIISAILYEPEIFVNLDNIGKHSDIYSQKLSFLGLSLKIENIIKYSSLILSLIYIMLTAFLVYAEYLRDQIVEIFSSLDSALIHDAKKINFPSLHTVISELSIKHNSPIVQIFFQFLNFLKSLLIYVLPVVVVITLLGEGLKRSSNVYLSVIFYIAPFMIFACMLILTKAWYITIWEFLKKIYHKVFVKKPKVKFEEKEEEKINLTLQPKLIIRAFSLTMAIIASIISISASFPKIIDILKKLFE